MISLFKKALTMLVTIPAMADASSHQAFRVINGSYKVSNIVITEKLKINGEAILGENTIVKDTMVVNGKLEAKGVTFEAELFSNGTTTLSKSWLNNNTHLSGTITTNNCHFLKNLSLLAQKSTYTNCNFSNVTVQKIPSVKTAPTIRLENGSIMSGDLTFEAGNGEAYLDSSSQIKGTVHGGKRIYD